MNDADERPVAVVAEGDPDDLDELERRLWLGPAAPTSSGWPPSAGRPPAMPALRDRPPVTAGQSHRDMNWRAIGCLVIGAAVFVGIGLLGMSFAFRAQPGCPDRLQWADHTYEAKARRHRPRPSRRRAAPSPSGQPSSA